MRKKITPLTDEEKEDFDFSLEFGGKQLFTGTKTGSTRQEVEKIYTKYKTAQAKKEIHNANLAELEELKARNELVHVDIVKQQASQAARIVRDYILSVPTRMSAILANQSEPVVRERLTTELRKLLEELSHDIK